MRGGASAHSAQTPYADAVDGVAGFKTIEGTTPLFFAKGIYFLYFHKAYFLYLLRGVSGVLCKIRAPSLHNPFHASAARNSARAFSTR